MTVATTAATTIAAEVAAVMADVVAYDGAAVTGLGPDGETVVALTYTVGRGKQPEQSTPPRVVWVLDGGVSFLATGLVAVSATPQARASTAPTTRSTSERGW